MIHDLFFYGTLMNVDILSRVIGIENKNLTTRDVILNDYARFHIKNEDYPAVVDLASARAVLARELTSSESCVRGSLVSGLTDADIGYLDQFEGHEYIRSPANVQTLDSTALLQAEVYIWIDPLSRLEPSIWSYEEFLKNKSHLWVGSEGKKEYEEVDRRRAMEGNIIPSPSNELESLSLNDEDENLPVFGKAFGQKYWSFEEGWTNINHGSYGTAPKVVIELARKIEDLNEAAPDRFMRKIYMPDLIHVRTRLAEFVGCDTDDLVVVANATTGVNVILNSLTTTWKENDKLLYFSTTIYDACASNLQSVVDTHPHLSLSLLPIALAYPISHAEVLAVARKAIEEVEASGGRVALALIDGISSNPGVIVPWEELVKLFREKGILSLVDAAHQIGQLPVNLRESQPDYWLSNCHKWLLGTRSCAVLYVAKKHQHQMHSIPIAHSYKTRIASPSGVSNWVSEFEWNGTINFSPALSLIAALDFRIFCGGEGRITSYCHNLAIEGGELVAKELGTETMRNKEGEGELVANMINVRLPVLVPSLELPVEERRLALAKQRTFLYSYQIDNLKTCAPGFVHNNIWWVRLSAQIYNDLDDFKIVAQALKLLCAKMNE